MEKKEILAYLTDHVDDCSSALLSSPKTITVKRSFVKHLENGRFVHTKSYKLKFRNAALESDIPLSVFVDETNTDYFYRYTLEFAEEFDRKLSDFCLNYPCRIQVLYEPEHITVEKLAGIFCPSNIIFHCRMSGTHSYGRFFEDLSSLLNKNRDKIADIINEHMFHIVANKFFGLQDLIACLNNRTNIGEFSYNISKDGKSIDVLHNDHYAYTIPLTETTEFGSASDFCDEIISHVEEDEKITDALERYKEHLDATGNFSLTYYQWKNSYRVIMTCNEIRVRKDKPVSEFVVNSKNINDLPKLLVDAQNELIKLAPNYGVYIERSQNGKSK